ncbi:MAG: tRNA dihydrouridine(20/20a) synthase DusA, partial [Methylocystis sp.]
MMDWTDRGCRYLHRLMTRRARLYTEMLTTGAVIHGDRARLMGFDAFEQPLAFQLGGSEPRDLAACARIAETFGYDEINLNVGCPSDRVQNGAFGACLMLRPMLVADCVRAMKDAVSVPVTVKCRIGVDDQEPRAALFDIAEKVLDAGADALVVHARKAWLKGLSPKENRDVPPLDYALVRELKRAFPNAPIAINGGLATIEAMREQLGFVDGVMVGRAAYHDPALLLRVDSELFGEAAPLEDCFEVVEAFLPYIEARLAQGERLSSMTRHMLGLFAGMPGA